MDLDRIDKVDEHETTWMDCQSTDVDHVHMSLYVPSGSEDDMWFCDINDRLCSYPSMKRSTLEDKTRLWKVFFIVFSGKTESLFFDEEETETSCADFLEIIKMKGSLRCRLILSLCYIWKKDRKSGCIVSVKQLQYACKIQKKRFAFLKGVCRTNVKKGCNLTTYLDSENGESISSGHGHEERVVLLARDHRLYGKYLKMLDLGIPAQAVNQKMQMAGMRIDLEGINGNSPMPEDWKTSHTCTTNEDTGSFLNVQLTKTEITEKEPMAKKSNFAITIEQITGALFALRKIGFSFT